MRLKITWLRNVKEQVYYYINIFFNKAIILKEPTDICNIFYPTTFQIKDRYNNKIGEFKMVEFPGCCGICILYNVIVHQKYQKKGIGTEIFKKAEQIASKFGYSKIMCTDVLERPSDNIITKLGWKHIDIFVNTRTNNEVNISIKKIK